MSNQNQKTNEKILGIDLGTTNSAAAIYEGGHATVIPSAEGPTMAGKMFPSVVAFTKDGQLLVGEPAKRQATTNPEGTVFEIKRKMGSDYKVSIYGKEYTPQQISAFILQKIKKDTETYLGSTINKAVIPVPAHFNDNQRQATKDAGEIAGFQVMRIINEPTAACLAYGIDKVQQEMKILIFSFGGGTHDVTVMDFDKGLGKVLSTSGDTQLGGTDVDKAVVDYILEEFKRQNGIDISNDRMAMARLKEAAEKAKIELINTYELRNQSALPYGRRIRPKTPDSHINSNKTGISCSTNRTANSANNPQSPRRCQTYSSKHRQNYPHRRHDQNATCPEVRRANSG